MWTPAPHHRSCPARRLLRPLPLASQPKRHVHYPHMRPSATRCGNHCTGQRPAVSRSAVKRVLQRRRRTYMGVQSTPRRAINCEIVCQGILLLGASDSRWATERHICCASPTSYLPSSSSPKSRRHAAVCLRMRHWSKRWYLSRFALSSTPTRSNTARAVGGSACHCWVATAKSHPVVRMHSWANTWKPDGAASAMSAEGAACYSACSHSQRRRPQADAQSQGKGVRCTRAGAQARVARTA